MTESSGGAMPFTKIEEMIKDCNKQGISYLHDGDHDAAINTLNRAMGMCASANFQDCEEGRTCRLRLEAITLNNKGCALKRIGNYESAIDAIKEAICLETTVSGGPSPSTLTNYSACLNSVGRSDEAIVQCRISILALRKLPQDPSTRHLLIVTFHNLALAQMSSSEEKHHSESSFEQAMSLAKNMLPSDHPTMRLLEKSKIRILRTVRSNTRSPPDHHNGIRPRAPNSRKPSGGHFSRKPSKQSGKQTYRAANATPGRTSSTHVGVKLPRISQTTTAAVQQSGRDELGLGGATFGEGSPITKQSALIRQRAQRERIQRQQANNKSANGKKKLKARQRADESQIIFPRQSEEILEFESNHNRNLKKDSSKRAIPQISEISRLTESTTIGHLIQQTEELIEIPEEETIKSPPQLNSLSGVGSPQQVEQPRVAVEDEELPHEVVQTTLLELSNVACEIASHDDDLQLTSSDDTILASTIPVGEGNTAFVDLSAFASHPPGMKSQLETETDTFDVPSPSPQPPLHPQPPQQRRHLSRAATPPTDPSLPSYPPISRSQSSLGMADTIIYRRVENNPRDYAELKRELLGKYPRTASAPTSPTGGEQPESPKGSVRDLANTHISKFEQNRLRRLRNIEFQADEERRRSIEIEETRKKKQKMDEMLRQAEERKARKLYRAAYRIQCCWRRKEERRKMEEKYLRMRQKQGEFSLINKYAEKWLNKTCNLRLYLTPREQRQAVNGCCVLQRAWRVYKAKHALSLLNEFMNKKRVDKMKRERMFFAASRIQSLARMLMAKRRVRVIVEDHQKGAVRTVTVWWLRVKRRLEVARKYHSAVEKQTSAAQTVQKNWRGFSGRLKASDTRLRQRIDQLRMVDWNAAILIQRLVRGHFSRGRVEKCRELRNLIRSESYGRSYICHEEDGEFSAIFEGKQRQYQMELEDAIRRPKLPAANQFMEECRQQKMRQISRHAQEYIRENFSTYSGIRDINNEWRKQHVREAAQKDYQRAMSAVCVIQKAFREWLSQLSPEKRAFNTRFRALSKERRDKRTFLSNPILTEVLLFTDLL